MEATHQAPAWCDRADFIIGTEIEPNEAGVETEQLWARRISQTEFEVCCIPFFAYDIALGDIVETTADFTVRQVSKPSGRFVFRVFFTNPDMPKDSCFDSLVSLGATCEWSSANLLAVDAEDEVHAQRISNYLLVESLTGSIFYETGRS